MEETQEKTKFDDYKEDYREQVQSSTSFVKADNDYILEAKANAIKDLVINHLPSGSEPKALDIGCGIGLMDRLVYPHVHTLCGIDVEDGILEKAKTSNPNVEYKKYDGKKFPYEDHSFDLVFAVCVVHHVPPKEWKSFLKEMHRVTKPGGIVSIFEHNPYNPLTQVVVNRCEFDKDAVLTSARSLKKLSQDLDMKLLEQKFILFFPWKNSVLQKIESGLSWLPLGGQYYVAWKKS